MTKHGGILLILATAYSIMSCDNPIKIKNVEQSNLDSTTTKKENYSEYKSIKYIDSFLNANNGAINKNNALKEHYESLCTKEMLPLIDKKGFYEDIPFKLAVTTTHKGIAYGNFIFEDDKHYIKVECIIKEKQLLNLQENNRYLIKFKTFKFTDGVSFDNSFSKIELPTVDAYLISFKPYLYK
ncbi:MAG: hypothetical protein JWQ09_2775 [Segetibacter sp.]|nr:hypothetical protein [Segetibacter sp.]